MVGDPALWKIVGADAFAERSPLPISPLRVAASFAARSLRILVAQPRLQHRHGLGLVAVLRAVVLAFDDQPGGQVGDADRAESVLLTCWPPAPLTRGRCRCADRPD